MRIFITAALPSALLLAGAVAGCASQPVPTADLTRAHTLVAQAQASDAPRYDSVDLSSAQDKLQQADSDAQSQPKVAGEMAQEASADAELSMARTQDRKAQDSLGQVNDSLTALRQQDDQLERDNARDGAAPGTPVSPPQAPQGAQQ
jgi:hypothetical protein